MSASPLHVAGCNRIIELMPAAERERLLRLMEPISVQLGDVVFERNQPLEYVDFPLDSMVSLVVITEEGDTIEAGTVGNEGVAGVPLVLGASTNSNRAFYQLPGRSMRMGAQAFTQELQRSPVFDQVVRRYAHAYLTQVSQSAACNRLHPVEQRLCRWILMCSDRVGSDHLALTQEIIAQMLGVRRASVSVVAGILQNAGFIRYARGMIEILNREALENGACECYAVIHREFERLLVQ